MKTWTLCLLATLAIALAAPSASAFEYEGTGPPPSVPCPDLPPGNGGVVGMVLDAADTTAATTCTAVAGYEATAHEAYADAEENVANAVGVAGPFIDLAQDGACTILFGTPDGSDDLPPYSRDLCKEVVVSGDVAAMDLCRYMPCGWQA